MSARRVSMLMLTMKLTMMLTMAMTKKLTMMSILMLMSLPVLMTEVEVLELVDPRGQRLDLTGVYERRSAVAP